MVYPTKITPFPGVVGPIFKKIAFFRKKIGKNYCGIKINTDICNGFSCESNAPGRFPEPNNERKMIQWANKIQMSDEAAKLTSNPDAMVDFTYINIKNGKETTKRMTIQKAVELAEERREDGRYKNYEYFIG